MSFLGEVKRSKRSETSGDLTDENYGRRVRFPFGYDFGVKKDKKSSQLNLKLCLNKEA